MSESTLIVVLKDPADAEDILIGDDVSEVEFCTVERELVHVVAVLPSILP